MAYVSCLDGDVAGGGGDMASAGRRWQRATWRGDSGGDVVCCLPTSLNEGRGTRSS